MSVISGWFSSLAIKNDIAPAGKNKGMRGQCIGKNGKGVLNIMLARALANSFRRGDVVVQRVTASDKKGGKCGLKMIYAFKPSVSPEGCPSIHARL
jgi:hypothetical protein